MRVDVVNCKYPSMPSTSRLGFRTIGSDDGCATRVARRGVVRSSSEGRSAGCKEKRGDEAPKFHRYFHESTFENHKPSLIPTHPMPRLHANANKTPLFSDTQTEDVIANQFEPEALSVQDQPGWGSELVIMSDPMDDSVTEDIWASPEQQPTKKPQTPRTPKTPPPPRTPGPNQGTEYDREAALRKELEGVRTINASIEGLIRTLERAQENMTVGLATVSGTVNHASTLLNTWTRILSQTEHNQRLILDPTWRGATQDVLDIEAEALRRQQAAERRAAEEERKREAARRKREEEEQGRQKQAAVVGRTPSSAGNEHRHVAYSGCQLFEYEHEHVRDKDRSRSCVHACGGRVLIAQWPERW
ncbi:hypothetical protein SODALDRAFT_381833 [Sodiomyces alkalinus F11]|uniref:DASH complex subunit DUO1 n=1 Tax=Sodiomyces alkalinus (strain CBS 110278 / VKM F-3762 / F11) TaxID=1314773 RepID=A0A3N2PKK9_SODAK|nr:hypothetical protein SODALDRAFT_381833 [Sodiomyces alkalinus F11]ROT34856.1 hypothetical protein SODALDRAFT_381833 [Sodiomyces alkalinus F11]